MTGAKANPDSVPVDEVVKLHSVIATEVLGAAMEVTRIAGLPAPRYTPLPPASPVERLAAIV